MDKVQLEAPEKELDPASSESLSDVFRYLVNRSGKQITTISEESGITLSTLYSLYGRNSRKSDIRILKRLADYFGEDLSIFCGLATYEPPKHLTDREQLLLDRYNSLTDTAKTRIDEYLADVVDNPKNLKA